MRNPPSAPRAHVQANQKVRRQRRAVATLLWPAPAVLKRNPCVAGRLGKSKTMQRRPGVGTVFAPTRQIRKVFSRNLRMVCFTCSIFRHDRAAIDSHAEYLGVRLQSRADHDFDDSIALVRQTSRRDSRQLHRRWWIILFVRHHLQQVSQSFRVIERQRRVNGRAPGRLPRGCYLLKFGRAVRQHAALMKTEAHGTKLRCFAQANP